MPPPIRTRARAVAALVAALVALLVLASAAPASAVRRPGIDISAYQEPPFTGKPVDWDDVGDGDVRFVIARATRGTDFIDTSYPGFVSGAQSHGIWVAAYHYAKPNGNPVDDAKKEADFFLEHADIEEGMLIPALDMEQSGLTQKQLVTWITTWLRRVEAQTGVKAMIYTSPSFWVSATGDTVKFARNGHPLWIANWFVRRPTVPAHNWGGRGWTFWQWTDCGEVNGIKGCVDKDRYNGKTLAKVAID